MRITKRISVIVLGAALVLAVCVHSVHAGNKRPARPTSPAYYNGETVYVVPGNNGNVVGVDNTAIAEHAANPLYLIPGQEVDKVLSTVPGVAGYNPYWDIILVNVLPGARDQATDPFLSEADILDAWANGEVELLDQNLILLCQVVPQ